MGGSIGHSAWNPQIRVRKEMMAGSITRIIRKALPEIIQSKDATISERLEACRLLWRIRARPPRASLAADHSRKKGMAELRPLVDAIQTGWLPSPGPFAGIQSGPLQST